MPGWTLSTRMPVSTAKELEELKSDIRTKKGKAQVAAAQKAAGELVKSSDGPVNVVMSGYAAGKNDEPGTPDQVSITVADAPD